MKKLVSILLCSVFMYGMVDINHASMTELNSLKGIGKVKAERILNYVKKNGCFKNVDELVKVKGISTKTILKNKESLEVKPCSK